jgi:hypothetical protein
LGERLSEELQLVGKLENRLVDRSVPAYWRLRRLGRVEAGMFASWELYGEIVYIGEYGEEREASHHCCCCASGESR